MDLLSVCVETHKVLGPGIDGEESQEAPEQLAWGLAFPEATRAGL